MITELLLNVIYSLINFVATPISFVLSPLGSLDGLIELLSVVSIFVPLHVLGACLSLWLSYYGIKFIMVVVNWIIAKFPTIE